MEISRRFFIDAEQMMRRSHHTRFYGGWPVFADDPSVLNIVSFEDGSQCSGMIIISNQTYQCCAATPSGQVHRYISGSAGFDISMMKIDDGHRSFRGDTFNSAIDIFVHHDIPDHHSSQSLCL